MNDDLLRITSLFICLLVLGSSILYTESRQKRLERAKTKAQEYRDYSSDLEDVRDKYRKTIKRLRTRLNECRHEGI